MYVFSKQYCVKRVRIRAFSGPFFPAFGLNTERYGMRRVQMRENTDQKNSEYGQFAHSSTYQHAHLYRLLSVLRNRE